MAQKKITDLQLRDDVDAGLNIPSDDGLQTYRITAAQIKTFVLANFKPPTISKVGLSFHTGGFSANGTGTYTKPADCSYIRVRMVGGGGGGGGSGLPTSPVGSPGSDTTFGSSLLVAGGGGGGSASGAAGQGGPGGTASLGTGPIGTAVYGGDGQGLGFVSASGGFVGGQGGSSMLGANGGGGSSGQSPATPLGFGAGGGGGGASAGSSTFSGAGGGGGGGIDAIIPSVSATYSYTVGAGGAGGPGGSGPGWAGAPGQAGYIEVTEYYQ